MTTVMNSGTATQLPVKDIATTGLDEQRMLQKRQNEQMLIYLFICLAIVLAWMLGTWQFSFVWVFGIALFTLVTWRFKVMTLIEKNIQYYETILHRRRRLRQSETAEWLNFLVNRW
jgi:Ca2+-dependent lipid-binding protein